MANSNNSTRYLSVASGHIDSLINYVLDVKPYHTKLSEIVEEFLFEDHLNVKIVDKHKELVVMGVDLLNKSSNGSLKVWEGIGASRPLESLSSERTVISDGTRRTFPIPTTAISKLLSHSSQEQYVVGVDDDTQIVGLPKGVLSTRRFDGFGIPHVTKNGTQATESVDYHVSHGAFSFNTYAGSMWKESNIASNVNFAKNPGTLAFNNVYETFGSIVNITSTKYEEFTLQWIAGIQRLKVVGSVSGNLGNVAFGQTFSHAFITFTFSEAYGDAPGTFPYINDGDKFLLTPREKITVHPSAPEETWTIVKTNPQALAGAPTFTRTDITPIGVDPTISIFTHALEWTPQSTWTITFTSATEYEITVAGSVSGYPRTGSDLAYEDEFIHFNLTAPSSGFKVGDKFEFQVKAKKENYLVFGSVSGWQPSATIGEWYWNGKIGFKIPALEYFAIKRSATISTSEDLVNWDPVVVTGQELTNISYINNAFLASGAKSIVASSTDGFDWTDDMTSFAAIDERLIVVGENGFIAITEDGVDWHQVASHTDKRLRGIDVIPTVSALEAATDNMIVAVGDNGTIITSLNGLGWTTRISNVSYDLHSVAHDANWIVAVGKHGTIIRSQDRINWIPCTSPTTNTLNKVKYLNGQFLAVGDGGTILKSADGITWISLVSNTDKELNDIAYGLNTYVAIGKGAVTCTSFDLISWQATVSRPINAIEFGEEEQVFVIVETKVQQAANFTPLRPVHSTASPSLYSAIFRSPVTGNSIVGGTVCHNTMSYGKAFKVDIPWFDKIAGFVIGQSTNSYNPGEQIDIYLVPKANFVAFGDYDELPYDSTLYDSSVGKIEYPLDLLQEYFPLYHNHNSLIFKNVVDGDRIVVDKANNDSVRFKVGNGETPPSSLAPINGWIPLEFRYDVAFPSMATTISAYLASDYDVKVFQISQPTVGGLPGTATLTFDETFFTTFLPERTYFSLRFNQADSYGQTIHVKVSENMRMYSRVRLNFNDIALVNVSDTIQTWNTVAFLDLDDLVNVGIDEGGMFSRLGYESLPYDILPYDTSYYTEQIQGLVEVPPGSGNYVYTGNPTDVVVAATIVNAPAIAVSDKVVEASSAAFTEGLQITVQHVGGEATEDQTIVDTFPTDYSNYDFAGTSIIYNPDRNEVWAGMSSTYVGFNRLDPETGAQLGYIAANAAGTTALETDLGYPAYDPINKRIYAGNYSVAGLLQFDSVNATFIKRIPWPSIQWFGVHPTTGNLWATIGALGSGRLQCKHPVSETILLDVPLSTNNAGEIVFDNDGNIWVTENNYGSPVLCQYDQSGNLLYTHTEPQGVLHMEYDKDRNSIWYGIGSFDPSRSTGSISNITLGNPTIVEFSPGFGPGFITGQRITVQNVSGTVELNNKSYIATVVDATHLSLAVDSTSFTAYSGGGDIKNNARKVKELRVATKTIDKVLDVTSQSYSFSQDLLYDSARGVIWVLSNFNEEHLIGYDTTTGERRYVASMPDWNPYRATVAGSDIWINEDNFDAVMRARFIDGSSGGGEVISLSMIYNVNSTLPVRAETYASEYLVTHNYVGSTPTVIITPDVGAPFVVEPELIYTPSAGAQVASFKFTVPVGTGPFKLTLS